MYMYMFVYGMLLVAVYISVMSVCACIPQIWSWYIHVGAEH